MSNVSRFKENKNIGVIVAIRAEESMDRRTVLRQGDFDTGRYGTQYDCAVFSPFMDLPTKDLWKINSALNLDINDIYDMMWEASVPLAKQRIGSPINSHAGDSVKLYKVLNPTTYGKMVGRVDSIDFTASYGGVFNNGFKYIKLEQPRPFYKGMLNDDSLIEALNVLDVTYVIRDIKNEESVENYNEIKTSERPVKQGDNIRLCSILPDFARRLAADKMRKEGNEEKAQYFEENIPKLKNWYDYMLQLTNNAEPMYKKSWIPKIETSIKHWKKEGSCVNEATIVALRVISNRKNKRFGIDDYDYEEFVDWAVAGFTDISRKPILKYFRYNQDCAENIARRYIYDILENWDNGGKEEFENNKYLNRLILDNDEKLLSRIGNLVDFVTLPGAKETHQLVLDNDTYHGDRFDSIQKKSGKAFTNKDETDIVLEYSGAGIGKKFEDCDAAEQEQRIKIALCNLAYSIFHDQVRESANFKRIVIAELRNDAHFTYLGFGQSSEEKLIRANCEAAFAENEKDRQEKLAKFNKLKAKIEKENAEND